MPTKLISLRIDTELLEYIEERAEKEHRTVSNMINVMLTEAKEQKKVVFNQTAQEIQNIKHVDVLNL